MKELRRNMRLVGALVVAAFLTLSGWFALTVFEQGSIWASNSYNTRLTATGAQRGDITDRDGVALATTQDGERVYLENTAARRALAATVGDTAGMSGTGIEGYYSSQLLDISGSLVERLSALFNGTERKGSSVKLTVDAQLTAYISSIFPSGYRGAVCVLNYETGEILAMVSKPDYDPYDAAGEDVEDTAYLNRCLQGLYTPGSVFKIVTLAAALEHDPNVLGQTFVCSGEWAYEGGSIVCAGRTAHGTIDLETAFARSCNVTFGKLAYQLGLERLRETAEALGFNENFKFSDFALYNSQFPTEISNTSDLVWSGIGQGTVLVTADAHGDDHVGRGQRRRDDAAVVGRADRDGERHGDEVRLGAGVEAGDVGADRADHPAVYVHGGRIRHGDSRADQRRPRVRQDRLRRDQRRQDRGDQLLVHRLHRRRRAPLRDRRGRRAGRRRLAPRLRAGVGRPRRRDPDGRLTREGSIEAGGRPMRQPLLSSAGKARWVLRLEKRGGSDP